MDTIFEGLKTSKVAIYIKDITVFSLTMEQHLIDLDLNLNHLAEANLKVSFKKCVLSQVKVKVLST